MSRRLSVLCPLCSNCSASCELLCGAQQSKVSVSRYPMTMLITSWRNRLLPAASWFWMSSARDVREVSGMRCCFKACCAETRRSHSRAIAEARWGFEDGMVNMVFEGVRTGRLSRSILKPSFRKVSDQTLKRIQWQSLGRTRNFFHRDVFPKTLLYRTTGLHLARTKILTTLE